MSRRQGVMWVMCPLPAPADEGPRFCFLPLLSDFYLAPFGVTVVLPSTQRASSNLVFR